MVRSYVVFTNRDRTHMPATVVRESAHYITLQYTVPSGHRYVARFHKNDGGKSGQEVGIYYTGYKYFRLLEN
jgi:hypothetical protein